MARRPLSPGRYLRTNARITRVFSRFRGLVDGAWLGLADQADLHALDAAFYAGQSQYLDPEYTLSGFKDWEQAAVERWFVGCHHVLVTGAGGGRELVGLRRTGVLATGVEPNEDMVRAGRALLTEHGLGADLLLAPRDGWPALSGEFDGAIIGWGSYTHIAGRETRVAFLRRLRRLLPEGAPVLVSVYARPSGVPYHHWVRRVGTAVRRLRGAPALDLGDGLAPMYAHHFSRVELAEELADAGLVLVHWQAQPFAHAVATAGPA